MELDGFLAALPGPNPSGVDLRNESRFHAIERLLEPAARSARAEAEASSGPGGVAIDWGEVLSQASDLATMGRDLRLLVFVVRALAGDRGFAGLAEGLDLLSANLDTWWDSIHPVLRESPSRREAATRRISALMQLQNSDNGLLCDLEFGVVLRLRGLGLFTGADLAAGAVNRATFVSEAPSGLGEKEMAALIARHEARVGRVATACKAMSAEQPEELAGLVAGLGAARTALGVLEDRINARVEDNGIRVLFPQLSTLLHRIEQTLRSGHAAAAGLAQGVPAMPDAAPASPAAAAAASQVAPIAANGAGIPGRISSRDEVERCLDLIIDFYERTEPSSPIPHLARRVRKMVPMNFMQLMEEIAPSGMKEFRNAAGVLDDRTK